MLEIIVWIVVILLFALGLLGTVLPLLPGSGLVFAGIILYALVDGFETITPWHIALFAILTFATLIVDYIGSVLGVKLGGGSRLAMIGAFIGGLGGLLFSPLGLLIGTYVGAVVGAILEGYQPQVALRTAVYAVLGTLGATVTKILITVAMIGTFFALILTG